MPLKFLGKDAGRLPRVDRYELIAEIASGGMASVFLARLVGVGGFERFFAIKRLHPHLGNEEGFVSMFLDEARIVAGIRHQHVVPVLEVGASEHGYYLVMEYIEGETLGSFISRGIDGDDPIPPEVAVRILIDTLAGLHAAHEHVDPDGNPIGLVHRDVSPQNILVDINGVARIADFGVAHATSRLSSTRSGQLKGKVAYMAPEQARGQVVTPRSDVFAAGIVLWESLCRNRLFLADNEAVTLNRLIFEPIPKLREVNPKLPGAVEKVVSRALERDPAKRYATAADMADDLQVAARASRMLGSPSDVRSYVRNVIGVAMEHRRASVRDHLALMAASSPGDASDSTLGRPDLGVVKPSDSSVSSAAMAVPTPLSHPSSALEVTSPAAALPSRSSRKLAVFVAAGAMVGLMVVAAGWVALVESSRPAGPAAGSSAHTGSAVEPQDAGVRLDEPADAAKEAAATTSASAALPSEPSIPAPSPEKTRTSGSSPTKPPTGLAHTASAVPPATTTPAPPSTPPATSVPPGTAAPAATDDLKRNPYR